MTDPYDLKVLILGETKKGKSTVAHFVAQKLRDIGFDCNVKDLDFPIQPQEALTHAPERLQALTEKKTKIFIETKQVGREGIRGKN